jgi:N-acetylglutamate synthase-like GNAT family acetyltransferase
MLHRCTESNTKEIYDIINDAASAYKGVIPEDRWHEPYMPMGELMEQIEQGVQFWCYKESGRILGVMGIQDRGDVTLIRHAYVCTEARNKGIGSKLLHHLTVLTTKPVLIGTWADASWAIRFYENHGFQVLPQHEKNFLLAKYWSIPQRQMQTSVVLADKHWSSKK